MFLTDYLTHLSVLVFPPAGCKYTCHAQCRDQVALDCHQNGSINSCQLSPLAQDHFNNNQSSHSVSTELIHVCLHVYMPIQFNVI